MPSRPEDGRPPAAPSPPPATSDDVDTGPGRSACVLYHAPGSIAPPALVASLQRHGATVRTCTDPYAMLAHACKLTGATTVRRAAAVLVFVEPAGLTRVVELATTLRRYVPRSALWYFEEAGDPKLRAVTATELAAWSPRPSPADALSESIRAGRAAQPANPWTPARPLQPALRLTEAIDPARPIAPGGPALRPSEHTGPESCEPTHAGGPLLSAEELAMLLGEADGGFDDDLEPTDGEEAGEGRHA
ncbi:MAG: hypothetical protein ACT4PL_11030 [Phycisphaerales bacterium]